MAAIACFGEILLRLSAPSPSKIPQADSFDVYTGGAEANVACTLAGLGHRVRMMSAVPANGLGLHALRDLSAEGVDTTHVAQAAGRMGLYFYSEPAGLRPGAVTYDRDGSAFARRRVADWDFDAALEGADHLHLSGITAALSSDCADAALQAMKSARAHGLSLSFDCNFRPALWEAASHDPVETIAGLIAQADMLFANHKDAGLVLGMNFQSSGSERREEAAKGFLESFPNLQAVASTARHIEKGGSHSISGRIDTRSGCFETEQWHLTQIVDRIGSGDAFSAGLLHAWLSDPNEIQGAVQFAMQALALSHYSAGDILSAKHSDIAQFDISPGDVRR